ncbi:MAG: dockerin type I domain-containing protein [Candidatus Magasanikbacteria bacterium]
MIKKANRFHRLILGIFISLFFVFLFVSIPIVLASSEQSLTASVTIINPLGPYVDIRAVPEKRIPNISLLRVLNRATSLKVKVYPAGVDRIEANVLHNFTSTTDDIGRIPYYLFEGLSQGTYDFTAKGYSHLTRLLAGVELQYFAILDFTDDGNDPLLSGDINMTEGDDEINALDISVLVNAWNTSDSRSDLNRDDEVNSIDISNLLANFNATGD